MNKILIFILAMMGFSLTACGQQKAKDADKKVLVAYFSATGTTEKVAKVIATTSNGTLYKITPEVTYTNKDLDWRDEQSRSSVEMGNPKARPAIKAVNLNVKDYEVIYLGYPIWWDKAPRIVNTFIESIQLEGKTVIPFATSGSSSIDNSVKELKQTYPNVNWQNGKLWNDVSDKAIQDWVPKT